MSEDEDHLTLIVPRDVKQFYEGRIVWDVKTFRKTDLNGFDFYPEVTVLKRGTTLGGLRMMTKFMRIPGQISLSTTR